jgi:Zn-dependent protease
LQRVLYLRALVSCLAFCLAGLRFAAAQPQSSESLRGLDSATFVQLEARVNAVPWIRTVYAGQRLTLRRPRLTTSGLAYDSALAGAPGPPLVLRSIDTIAVPHSREGEFVLGGALAVGSVGALYGIISQWHPCVSSLGRPCPPSPPFDGSKVARSTVVGALGGAVLGALLGAVAKEWQVVYRAPR